jgi:hypothetical protein
VRRPVSNWQIYCSYFWLGLLLAGCCLSAIAQTGSVVTVNSDNVLVINGRKVFPIGFSPAPAINSKTPTGDDALQEFRNAGALLFRMIQNNNWDSQVIAEQQAALDWATQHDMYVWLNLRELSQFSSTDTNTAAALRSLVDTFRNHPGLGLWKNFDEAWWGGVPVDNLKNGYDVIKQEDTDHPVVQTHAPRGYVTNLQPYNVAADVLAVDIYPVAIPPPSNPPQTNTQISVVGDWAQEIAQVANGQKEFWLIEQIAFSGTTPPGKTLTFPTFTQSRYMAYQAIINGARGLMYFGGNIAATLTNSVDASLGWNWTFWTNVLKGVVQQLGDHSIMAPALVTSNSSLPITISGTANPDLEFCVREADPYFFILASKREGTSTNVTFNGLPSWATNGEVLYESPRTVSATGGHFTDTFAPFDVHVYRFSQKNQAVSVLFPPQSRTNSTGTVATFTVFADGSGPLTYRWRRNGANLTDGGNLSGASSSTLTIANVAQTNAGSYDAIISGYGSVTSAAAVFVVTNPPVTVIANPVLLYEPFNYTNVGSPVNSNTPANWTFNGSSPNDLNVASGSLSYPPLADSLGNSVTNGGPGYGTRRLAGASVSDGVLYFSALFRINDLGYGVWNGAASPVGALTATDNQAFRLQVTIKSNSPTGYLFGVQKNSGSSVTFDSTEYHAGDTVCLVGKYDFTVSPNRVSLWINPASTNFGASAEAAAPLTATNGVDGYAIDRFNMRQNTSASVPAAMQWDELRIGTNWASVTPPHVPRLANFARLANGAVQFAYTNVTAVSYDVYGSTNLLSWTTLGPATQTSPGFYQFTDVLATNYQRRFYQLRSQ